MSSFPPIFQPRGSHPPRTNTERQRDFRRRHPDYYRLLQAKRRARTKAWLAAYLLAQRTEAAKALAAADPLALPAPIMTIPIPTRLALPAPVEQPEMAAIDRLKAMQAARVLVERSRAA